VGLATYLAEQFVSYWKLLSRNAMVPKLLQEARVM